MLYVTVKREAACLYLYQFAWTCKEGSHSYGTVISSLSSLALIVKKTSQVTIRDLFHAVRETENEGR